MLTTWKQADVFPIIAQVIRDEYAQKERFVTHDEIIARLLAHPEAVHLIEQAHEQQDKQRSHEWLAHQGGQFLVAEPALKSEFADVASHDADARGTVVLKLVPSVALLM